MTDSALLSPTAGIRAKLSNRQRSPTGLGPNAKARKQSQTREWSGGREGGVAFMGM